MEKYVSGVSRVYPKRSLVCDVHTKYPGHCAQLRCDSGYGQNLRLSISKKLPSEADNAGQSPPHGAEKFCGPPASCQSSLGSCLQEWVPDLLPYLIKKARP